MKYCVYQMYFDDGHVHINIRQVSNDYKPRKCQSLPKCDTYEDVFETLQEAEQLKKNVRKHNATDKN